MNGPPAGAGAPAAFALGSIAVGLLVLLLKGVAAWLTGSAALFSDAAESVVNVAAAAAAFLAIRTARRPADARHPYGHEKAEYLSAVLEGALIVLAALMILREAAIAFVTPRQLGHVGAGLLVNAAASALNGVWCALLFRAGRRHRSLALLADARHLLADVFTSAGVLTGFALASLTGHLILDPLLAALVAVSVLWSGWRLLRESVGGLMDEALSPDEREEIARAIAGAGGGSLQAHDLRTRRAGARTFVEFHLVVPGAMSVAEAHLICDRIEDALRRALGDAHITIHVEPHGKAKTGPGVVVAA